MEKYYTENEVAERLGCSKQMIRGMKKKGIIPLTAVTGSRYFASVIDNMIGNGFKPPESKTNTKTSQKAPKPTEASKSPQQEQSEDDFVREFWKQGDRGIDVLTLAPEIGASVVNHVNAALRYAFGKIQKERESKGFFIQTPDRSHGPRNGSD